MRKRLLSALLTVCMLLTMLPVTAFAATAGGNDSLVTLEYENDGVANNYCVNVSVYTDQSENPVKKFSVSDARMADNDMKITVVDSQYEIDHIEFDGVSTAESEWIAPDLRSYSFTCSFVAGTAETLNVSVYLRPVQEKPAIEGEVYDEYALDVSLRVYESQLLKMLHLSDQSVTVTPTTEIKSIKYTFHHGINDAVVDENPTNRENDYWDTLFLDNYHGWAVPYNVKELDITYKDSANANEQTVTIPAGDLRFVRTNIGEQPAYEVEAEDQSTHIVYFYNETDGNAGNNYFPYAIRFVNDGESLGDQMPDDPTYQNSEYKFVNWEQNAWNGDGMPFLSTTIINDDITVFARKISSSAGGTQIHISNEDDLLFARVAELANEQHNINISASDLKNENVKISVFDANGQNTDKDDVGDRWMIADDNWYLVNSTSGLDHIDFSQISGITVYFTLADNGTEYSVNIPVGEYPGDLSVRMTGVESTVDLLVNSANDVQARPDDPNPDPDPGTDYAITGITKTLVASAQAATDAGITGTYTFPEDNKVIIPYGESVTLLYAITVTGKANTTFTVTDEDATLVDTGTNVSVGTEEDTFTGSIPTGAESLTFYVSKTFTAKDIVDGKLTNTASITTKADGGVDEDNDDATEEIPAEEENYDSDIYVEKKLTSVQRAGESINITDGMTLEVDDQLTWTITVTNEGNKEATGLKLTDTLVAVAEDGTTTERTANVTAVTDGASVDSFTVAAATDAGPGKVEFTATYTVTVDDKGLTLKNTATVTNGVNDEEGKGEAENPVGGVYTLTYDANGGNEKSVPAQVTGIESGEYKLDTTTIPTHDPAAPSAGAEEVDVLFIGWMETGDSGKIYSRSDDTAPKTITEVTFADQNITVYAAWGYDEDGNGIPDVVEKDHIVITPADITIYSGGTGYSGVVTKVEGENVSTDTTNASGFPEPGYYITLPNDLDTALKQALGHNDGSPVDLSQYLTFSYDHEGVTREWKLERYDNSDGAASMANGKYIYRLVTTEGDQPVRLSITDENGNIKSSDEFNPAIGSLYQTFQMGIYAGDLDQNLITATVDIPNATDETTTDIEIGSGTLTVRGTTSDAKQGALDGSDNRTVITAEAADDATFTINGSELQIKDGNEVQLLVDELVADTATTTTQNDLKNKAATEIKGIDATHNFDFQYIDLVDSDNGNAWVKTDKDLTLTWEYPAGMTKDNADFAIVHYKGLDRDYTNAAAEIASTNVEAFEVEHTKNGLRFSAGASGFSPVALVYSNATGDAALDTYKITYDPNGGSGSARTFEYADASSITAKDNMFTRSNYTFTGWNTEADGSGDAYEAGNVIPATGDMTLYAQWDYNGSTSSGTTRYTLTYESNGGTEFDSERYTRNTTVQLDKTPTREGYTFTGWYADEDLEERITEIKMTSNKTVYAGWEPTDVPNWLNGDDHFSYIIGREDGLIHPDSNITRAEVATIFFRLLQEDVRDQYLTESNSFTDVSADAWYNTAISTMASMGIVEGDLSGTFRPDDNITRAEFAAIAARFSNGSYDGADIFNDIADHWAREEINLVASTGWLNGYTSGSFNPNREITRAESMTIVNRMLKRLPENTSDLLEGMIEWPDNQSESAWYYLAVQEATNSHDFERKDDGVHESWTELTENTDWEQYQ